MPTGFRTAFLDVFKHGDVDRDIRLLAAQGALDLRADERRALLELLVGDPEPEIAKAAEHTLQADSGSETTIDARVDESTPEESKKISAQQRIAAMTIAERLMTAIKGTREERAILIRDPNRIVAAAVLSSPRLTETEVDHFAKMTSVSEEVLRTIGNTRAWMKSYRIVSSLVRNSKTPLAVSMNLLSRLNETDVKMLSADRNVPEVLRTAARWKLHR